MTENDRLAQVESLIRDIANQIRETNLIVRAVAEQSQLHDRQIAQNTADIALLVRVVGEQGEYFRSVAASVERVAQAVEQVAQRVDNLEQRP